MHVTDAILAPMRKRYGEPALLEWESEISEREHALATYDPKRMHDVTLFFLNGERLALIRKPHFEPGVWRPPGGGVKAGEDFEDGVRREALEETGLEIELQRYLVVAEARFLYEPHEVPWRTHVFLADTTGSMGGAIDDVKTRVASIMGTVRERQPLAEFGVADYKDFDCGDDVPYTLGSAVTSDTAAVQTAISAWLVTSPFSGCDVPEAQLNALYRLATDSNVGWRADSSRIIAWFGDAPGHDPSGGHSLADVTAALTASPGIRIVAVSVNGGGLDATGQATALVNATHGTYQEGVLDSTVAAAITSGLQNLPVTLKPSTSCNQDGVTLSLRAAPPFASTAPSRTSRPEPLPVAIRAPSRSPSTGGRIRA